MTEISMAETVTIWKEGVCLLEQGNFQEALMKFVALEERTDSSRRLITPGRNLFNIGQSYLALGELDRAAEYFEESVKKDKMLAVSHYMLGNVNMALNRNETALQNFNDAYFYLRGNKLINYQPLGFKFRLYLCEIVTNRAIVRSRLGDVQEARDDFLMALQSKVEPGHRIIEDLLLCWQAGKNVEPFKVPTHAVFKPDRKYDAIQENCDYLGQSQVIAVRECVRFPNSTAQPTSPIPLRKVEGHQFLIQHTPAAKEAATGRRTMMTELRKKETRKSLKRVQIPLDPPNSGSPGLPGRQNVPHSQSPTGMSLQPPLPIANDNTTQSRFDSEVKPPFERLPPALKAKSPLPSRKFAVAQLVMPNMSLFT